MSDTPDLVQSTAHEDAAEQVGELTEAKRRCESARWPEHHDPRCAWCAFLAGGTGL